MKILFDFIAFIILMLIKIGDFVINLFSLILKVINYVFLLIGKFLNFIGELEIKNLNAILNRFKKLIQSFFSQEKQEKQKSFEQKFEHRKILKPKKYKTTVFFPIPILFKLKYFLFGTFFSLIFIFVPVVFFVFLQNLPSPQELSRREIPQTTRIYDRNGTLLYQIYANENRTIVPLSDIPLNLQNATIAIEDKDFYKHPGFDIIAITRSLIENLKGKELQGGSTITQQLIKTSLLTPETTISRKIKEVILAFWAERIYDKKKIFEMYFNQIAYGGTSWGAGAAAEVYFGKKVSDLDLAESAFLAGIPRAPSIYSPFASSNKELWKKRQREVLARMVALGFINNEEAKKADEQELVFQPRVDPLYAPHFVMFVKDLLIKNYGLAMVEKGGLDVITSLDLKLQDKVQKIVSDEISNDAPLLISNGASLVTNPENGDVLAMVGSADYSNPISGNVNLTTSFRSPGSSIKIITYAAALSHGLTAASMLDDSPATFPDSPPYSPVNYDGKFRGKISLRMALANSLNLPAVKTLNQVGIQTMVNLARDMGIKSWDSKASYGLSITLGGREVTMYDLSTAYGVLANQGARVDLNPILKVTDHQGDVLEEKRPVRKKVLDQGVAFILSDILADNPARAMEFGSNSPLYIPNYTVSVKTGTSDNKRDNWTVGYTKDRVVAVWVGNNDNSPMSQTLASGITGAAPIWNKVMSTLLEGKPDSKFSVPSNVIQKDCIERKEYFIKGTENSINCNPPPPTSLTPTPKP